ncbi:MAG TPA: arsenate reductase [Lentisphaeria bacterium]|nr:arsenate reductase [Lentisphaeria bacterium]|tara:strand:- start:374 stop:724 length:351 start_codon:yes stop_codon:yes gene_type:complete
MLTYYGYAKCGTCRKAQKALASAGIASEDHDITIDPPSRRLLERALASGYTISDLFNKSGVQYRELKMKDKVKSLPESELLDLLAGNGRLIKRPIVTDGERVTIGYKEEIFDETWC